jgi:hypothetical protein
MEMDVKELRCEDVVQDTRQTRRWDYEIRKVQVTWLAEKHQLSTDYVSLAQLISCGHSAAKRPPSSTQGPCNHRQ